MTGNRFTDYLVSRARKSFAGSWEGGDTLSSIVGAFFGLFSHFTPLLSNSKFGSPWLFPFYSLAAVLSTRFFFFVPYRMWLEKSQLAEVANNKLIQLSMDRCLQFSHMEFNFESDSENDGPLKNIRFNHINIGNLTIGYKIKNVSLEIAGEKIEFPDNDNVFYAQPMIAGWYEAVLPSPYSINVFPVDVFVNYDYEYDTLPETGIRRSGSLLRSRIFGCRPGSRVDGHYFEIQREQ